MAISFVRTDGNNKSSGGTITFPFAATSAGDLVVLIVGQKPQTANGGGITTPTGYTPVTNSALSGAGGYGAVLGVDTGNTNIFAFYRIFDGSEVSPILISVADDNISWCGLYVFNNTTKNWDLNATTGEDSVGGNVSITFSADPGVAANDYLLAAMCIPTDVTTPAQFSAEALSQTGITFGAVTEIEEPDSSLANDIGGFVISAPVSSGTSSAAPVMTATAGGTTTNVRGPGVFIRIREIAATTTISANAGSYAVSGVSATLLRTYAPENAAAGSYGVTGFAATLSKSSAVATAPTGGWLPPPDLGRQQTAEARRLERERLGILPKQQRAIDRAAVRIAEAAPIAQGGLLAAPDVLAAPAFDRLLEALRPTEGMVAALVLAIMDRIAWMQAEQDDEEAIVRLMMEMD